jgi:hypothetical protein
MKRDLPGQLTLFPNMEPAHAACSGAATGVQAGQDGGAVDCLSLPCKPTCTAGEAARHTGFSVRQIRYFVCDGSLLAINAARVPVGKRAAKRRGGKLDRWRIVVRRGADFQADRFSTFQTLEEFISSRLNKESV